MHHITLVPLLFMHFVLAYSDFSSGSDQQSRNFWKVVTVNTLLEMKSNWLVHEILFFFLKINCMDCTNYSTTKVQHHKFTINARITMFTAYCFLHSRCFDVAYLVCNNLLLHWFCFLFIGVIHAFLYLMVNLMWTLIPKYFIAYCMFAE